MCGPCRGYITRTSTSVEDTEARNDCAGEGHQQFHRSSCWMSQFRLAAVRGEVIAEAGDGSGTQEEGKHPPLEAVTKQRLRKTEKTICVL
jgi:hypothetical protein